MASLPSRSIDLVVTDPPYIVDYQSHDGRKVANDDNGDWVIPAFDQMARLLKPNSFCVSFYGWSQVDLFMDAWKDADLRPVGHIVWVKPYISGSGVTHRRHEQAYILANGDARPRFVLEDVQDWGEGTGNRLHPTEKPSAILEPLIEAFSDPGAIVLDPFAGSGSTLEAAKLLGRRYLGIELDHEHAMSAARRVSW